MFEDVATTGDRPTTPEDATGFRATAVTAQIVRAVTTVGLLSVLARFALAGRDIALANKYGTSAAVDAFVVALILPLFAVQVIAGALPYSFLPTYTSVEKSEGRDAAGRLVAGTLTLAVALAGITIVLLTATGNVSMRLLGSAFDAHKLALTRSLFFDLLPMVAFSSLAVIWAAILNAHHRFALAAITPAFGPLLAVASITVGPASWGIHGVAWAMSIGAALEAIILATALLRFGLSPWPRWTGYDDRLRSVVRQYAPAVGGALLMSSTLVVDQAVAAAQGSGSVAALNYGGKVISFILGTATVAIGTVVLPHMSAITARTDWNGLRTALRSYSRAVVAVTVPLTLVVIVASSAAVQLLFEHGAFTSHDAHLVTRVQILYALQIPFYLLCIVGVRTLSALRRNHAFVGLALAIVVLNIATDLAFVKIWGVPGIAASTSLDYFLACFAVFALLRRVILAEEARS